MPTDKEIEIKHTTYVAYKIPGLVVDEIIVREIDKRDPQQQAKDAPAAAFGFYCYDVTRVTITIDGEQIVTKSEPRNVSKTNFIDAEIFDAEAIKTLPGDNRTLLLSLQNGRSTHMVRCRIGGYREFDGKRHELISTN